MNYIKKYILRLSNFEVETLVIGPWLFAYTANSLVVWAYPAARLLGLFKSTAWTDFYIMNLGLAMVIGVFGLLTAFFPVFVIILAWDRLISWAEKVPIDPSKKSE